MANTLALGARVAVRVRHLLPEVKDYSLAFLYSSVVQLVERTTVNPMSAITIRFEDTKSGMKSRVNYESDFLIENVLKI